MNEKISVVIPVYNEEKRIEGKIPEIASYFVSEHISFEIILCNDGSTDRTRELLSKLDIPQLRVLNLPHKGKGHAVYQGVQRSMGEYILITDIDLSTPIEDFEKLYAKTHEGFEVIIGSREGLGAKRMGEPIYRHLMGRGFNMLVKLVALRGIEDTQCGFKLLGTSTAKMIFSKVKLYGGDSKELSVPAVTAYDVEMLFIAKKMGKRIAQVPVTWVYKKASTVDPIKDTWRNFWDVVNVRLNDLRGAYK